MMGVGLGVLTFFISIVEFCVICLQTGIFYGLVSSYISEVIVKPE